MTSDSKDGRHQEAQAESKSLEPGRTSTSETVRTPKDMKEGSQGAKKGPGGQESSQEETQE